jgi:hypothetical protein
MSIVLCGMTQNVALDKRLRKFGKYYQSNYIKYNGSNGICSVYGGNKNWHRIFIGKPEWAELF